MSNSEVQKLTLYKTTWIEMRVPLELEDHIWHIVFDEIIKWKKEKGYLNE
jgi:hypothetical protein